VIVACSLIFISPLVSRRLLPSPLDTQSSVPNHPHPLCFVINATTPRGALSFPSINFAYQALTLQIRSLPAADINLLKIPADAPDDKYVFLSDILPTAWNANEMGDVGEGDCVAIWGAGPGKTAACFSLRKGDNCCSVNTRIGSGQSMGTCSRTKMEN
jgi:hypothetical protein